MAVLRDAGAGNQVNYLATLVFLCGIACVSLMLKFGGFKASLNFYKGKRRSKEYEDGPVVSMNGAYRTNRDEFFGYSNYPDPQRQLTPTLRPESPAERPDHPLRTVKSASDLSKQKKLPPNLRQSNPSISTDPRGEEQLEVRREPKKDRQRLDAEKRVEKQRQTEQKKLEKQRLEENRRFEKQRAEEKKRRERQAALEQAKQEKFRKDEEKRHAQQTKKEKKRKGPAPQPLANPLARGNPKNNMNTLDSSISRSSGPPPYSELPAVSDSAQNEGDSSGNIIFSKPIDTGSWDLISQHRQQINRPVQSTPDRKQVVMDLKYIVDNENRENSEV